MMPEQASRHVMLDGVSVFETVLTIPIKPAEAGQEIGGREKEKGKTSRGKKGKRPTVDL